MSKSFTDYKNDNNMSKIYENHEIRFYSNKSVGQTVVMYNFLINISALSFSIIVPNGTNRCYKQVWLRFKMIKARHESCTSRMDTYHESVLKKDKTWFL